MIEGVLRQQELEGVLQLQHLLAVAVALWELQAVAEQHSWCQGKVKKQMGDCCKGMYLQTAG